MCLQALSRIWNGRNSCLLFHTIWCYKISGIRQGEEVNFLNKWNNLPFSKHIKIHFISSRKYIYRESWLSNIGGIYHLVTTRKESLQYLCINYGRYNFGLEDFEKKIIRTNSMQQNGKLFLFHDFDSFFEHRYFLLDLLWFAFHALDWLETVLCLLLVFENTLILR